MQLEKGFKVVKIYKEGWGQLGWGHEVGTMRAKCLTPFLPLLSFESLACL